MGFFFILSDVAISGSLWNLRGIWQGGLSFSQQYSITGEALMDLWLKCLKNIHRGFEVGQQGSSSRHIFPGILRVYSLASWAFNEFFLTYQKKVLDIFNGSFVGRKRKKA